MEKFPKSQLAAQLYTVRQYTQNLAGLSESLSKIRQMGYRAVQISGIGPMADEDVRRAVEDAGLVVCITHTPHDLLWHRTDAVIEQHRLWKCKNVAIGSMPVEYRIGEEGFHRFAQEANRVGEKLARGGLTFSYHNHAFEFVRFGKKTGMDILFEESDPRYVQFELDTYWIQYGGADPAAWCRKVKQRMPVVHLKDLAVLADGWSVTHIMAEVGEGNLNWPAILEACKEAGVQWYAVEQDTCQRDPFESLAISYRNLRALGME